MLIADNPLALLEHRSSQIVKDKKLNIQKLFQSHEIRPCLQTTFVHVQKFVFTKRIKHFQQTLRAVEL